MCKYSYKSKQCLYPTTFKQIQQNLPIDKTGFCLFHSEYLDWKIHNKFEDRIHELISYFTSLSDQKLNKEINLRGIVFPHGRYEKIWQKKKYARPLNFSNCTFHSQVHFEECSFQSIDFSGAEFKQRLFCKKTKFKQLVYSKKAVFQNGMHFDHCEFNNSVLFDQCIFNNKSNHPSVDLSIKNTIFNKPLDFSSSVFNLGVSFYDISLDGADFSDAEFHQEFFVDKAKLSSTILFQRSDFFFSENFGGYMSSVDLKNILLEKSGKIFFCGKEPFYDQVKGEIFLSLKEESEGTIMVENFNLNKFENNSKLKLFELEKKGNVEIGKGCRKYRHQVPPKRISLQKGNQNLVTELTNTFVDFFKNENGINLGVEVVGRGDDFIEIIYFTDENISFEEFANRLNHTEKEMWKLVKINTSSVLVTPTKNSLSENLIGATDTLINLAALMLKIISRIPLLKINKKELNELFKSTSFGATPNIETSTFETLNINQTILLGIGNTQEVKLEPK